MNLQSFLSYLSLSFVSRKKSACLFYLKSTKIRFHRNKIYVLASVVVIFPDNFIDANKRFGVECNNSFCIGYRSDIRSARDLDRPSSAKSKASYVFLEAQPTGD